MINISILLSISVQYKAANENNQLNQIESTFRLVPILHVSRRSTFQKLIEYDDHLFTELLIVLQFHWDQFVVSELITVGVIEIPGD